MRKVIYLSDFRRDRIAMRRTNQEIERIVNEVCVRNNVDVSDIDPVKLATRFGIKVQLVEFKDPDISGTLSHEGDSYTISVNKFDCYERKRFTIAHELGHYLLGHLKETDSTMEIFRKSGSGNEQEIEANKFAAALLINKSYAIKMYQLYNEFESDYIVIVKKLADIFQVSMQTMHYRLQTIGVN